MIKYKNYVFIAAIVGWAISVLIQVLCLAGYVPVAKVFIFFITLPFDINDAEVDRQTEIKTIASAMGAKTSKIICLVCGILYAFLILYLFMIENWRSISNIYLKESTIYFIWLLLILLQLFTFYQSDKVKKWVIKLIYDGSMILYFFILLFTVK